MNKNFYITTTLPYVNADPHVGFAMEIVRADAIARFKRLQGYNVFFNTGTDEHGQKIFEKAMELGIDPQDYVNEQVEKWKNLLPLLSISPDVHFIRTTDQEHVKAAQEFWQSCLGKGDIYKKNYTLKYCIGCELAKTDSEIVEGKCPIHPNLELEIRTEENYFFRFSKYEKPLLDLYKNNPSLVVPDFRFNEIKAFVERGLEDFSISRLKEKMPWGIPVPNDSDHVMYVWFDALVNYISTLGWPHDKKQYEEYWVNGTPVQYAGKDNLRQQSAMWQAMLISAGLTNTCSIVIDGFITSGGQKMSKSLGNTIEPRSIVDDYGTDAFRYFVLRELSTFEDSDFTLERFKEAYNGNLANGLGNLTSRIMKLAAGYLENPVIIAEDLHETMESAISRFELQEAMDHIWSEISDLDKLIQDKKPWETKDKTVISLLVEKLAHIGFSLQAFLPETSKKILEAINQNSMPSEPLFKRKD